MAVGFLNISHNFAGETDFIIVEWVKSTAQGTPVVGHVTGTGLGGQNDTDATEVNYPAAHVNEQLQITELPAVWFLVRFWRSADGVSKDVLLLEIAGNARTGAVYPLARYEYVVDRGLGDPGGGVVFGDPGYIWADPISGDTGIRDTRLADATYWVEERGTGSLLTTEITDRTDIGGGFDFVDPFKVMNSGAVYVVTVISRIDLPGDDSGSGVDCCDSDVYLMTSSQTYNPVTMGNRTIIVDIAAAVGTLTIPSLATLADSRSKIQTHGGAQRNLIIQLDAGDTVRFMGADVNKITLGKSEDIEILVKDNVMYVLGRFTGHDRLGQVRWAYQETVNTLKADGTLLALADYPRVAELIAALPAASVVSEVTWQTTFAEPDGQVVDINKGKFMSDGVNFRTPDLRDRMLKSLTSLAGGTPGGTYQHDAVKAHFHELRGGMGFGNYDGGSNPFWRIPSLVTAYSGDQVISDTGEVDNDVKSILLYPLICI
jgi:hypothetical protein